MTLTLEQERATREEWERQRNEEADRIRRESDRKQRLAENLQRIRVFLEAEGTHTLGEVTEAFSRYETLAFTDTDLADIRKDLSWEADRQAAGYGVVVESLSNANNNSNKLGFKVHRRFAQLNEKVLILEPLRRHVPTSPDLLEALLRGDPGFYDPGF